jgi:hypothetical protein
MDTLKTLPERLANKVEQNQTGATSGTFWFEAHDLSK